MRFPTSRGCISIYEAAWQALLRLLALCLRAPPLDSVTSRDASSILPKDRHVRSAGVLKQMRHLLPACSDLHACLHHHARSICDRDLRVNLHEASHAPVNATPLQERSLCQRGAARFGRAWAAQRMTAACGQCFASAAWRHRSPLPPLLHASCKRDKMRGGIGALLPSQQC